MSDIDGYTRVTEVLFFCSSLKDIPAEILKKAADRGTKVHEICDGIIAGLGTGPLDESVKGYVESFEKWIGDKNILKPERFFCDKYMITGECDGIYKDGQDLVLVDFKTPLKESSTWNIQLSAYAYLARLAGYPISRIEVVKLSKTGKEPEIYVYEELFEVFLGCLEAYKYFHDGKEKEDYLNYM